jgi:hypothetical protein
MRILIGLFTAKGEVSDPSYDRQWCEFDLRGEHIVNTHEVAFPSPSRAWGEITAWTGMTEKGTILFAGPLTHKQSPGPGDQVYFGPGAAGVTLLAV